MFKYLIKIQPLGLMYGSAGAFLSPENLVGLSGRKFPPDAATLSGLFLSTGKSQPDVWEELRQNLHVAGPFWTICEKPGDGEYFYVPLSRHKILGKDGNGEDRADEWQLIAGKWERASEQNSESPEEETKIGESDYTWQRIDYWDDSPQDMLAKKGSLEKSPWVYVPILHPAIQENERTVKAKDGLFVEYAVQMPDDVCLIYLSTHNLKAGWYQFGGENHIVEISSLELVEDSPILKLLKQPIQRACALITPGVWGSNNLSYRYPKHPDFSSKHRPKMLTDKAVPYRYRTGHGQTATEERKAGRLSRGRYAVPTGSVYVFKEPLNKPWWDFPGDWFPEAKSVERARLVNHQKPNEKHSLLKKMGCGLCLPIKIDGVD
jgi:CRISPR-associated protein Cmr3